MQQPWPSYAGPHHEQQMIFMFLCYLDCFSRITLTLYRLSLQNSIHFYVLISEKEGDSLMYAAVSSFQIVLE